MENKIKQAASMVITDEEFSEALHEVADFVTNYFKKEEATGMPAAIHVFTRHQFGEKLEHIVIIIPNFPPPIGASFSRYDLLSLAGTKFYLEFIKNKPSGKKCYPLAVFINSEAWMRLSESKSKAKNFEEAKKQIKKEKSFAETEDKQEIYITAGMTLDNRNNLAFLPITRLKNNIIMMGDPKYKEYKKENLSGSDLLISFYRGFMITLRKEGGSK